MCAHTGVVHGNQLFGIIGQGKACAKIGDISPGSTDSFAGSLTQIHPMKSYWFKFTGSLSTTITGELVEPATIVKTKPGWNYVAWP